jgi:hypothetical protein
LATNDGLADATIEVLNSVVLQLVDMNTALIELHHRMIVQGTYWQGIVDELRTLNGAVGRLEDGAWKVLW